MMLPAEDRRQVRQPVPPSLYRGIAGWLHDRLRLVQPWRGKFRQLAQRADAVSACSLAAENLPTGEVVASIVRMRQQAKSSRGLSEQDVDQVLAQICHLAWRSVGLQPYPVQIRCALALYGGSFLEMATGEGKSLAASLAAILLALGGRPVYVVTANDYLAERDASLFAPLYAQCQCTVAAITGATPREARRDLYACDVIYSTAREVLGDYLRDRLQVEGQVSDLQRAIEHALLPQQAAEQLVMRGIHAVIIDEADSVLIDDAVMPLILSAPRKNVPLAEATRLARELVHELQHDVDFTVNRELRQIRWTDKGVDKLDDIKNRLPRIWQGRERCQELMTVALMAQSLFFLGEHYVIQDDKLVLVDAQTGRLTPNRNLGIGLHQAVEAKEGLALSEPTETIARFSFQRFFRLFPHLCGISGTMREAGPEIWRTYHTPVMPLPTHRPVIRRREPWLFFRSTADKYAALLDRVRQVHATGQPLLLGSRTVAVSELLAGKLAQAGISCQVLNAVRHEEEAQIIAQAGEVGSITIATNMAGRGTDIKLTSAARALGGLYVIAVEPQRSGRLDRQLHGRSGRQGDPGVETTFISLEDELFVSILPPLGRRLSFWALKTGAGHVWPTGKLLIHLLQARAERLAAEKRLAILASDDWLDKHLAVIAPINTKIS
jgi:preprotein translocase subunit SecA